MNEDDERRADPPAADGWQAPARDGLPEPDEEGALVVDLDGFEGPLDLLLALARTQKVDLSKISILALADQYLAYVESLGRRRLDLAADYLVMAAWLAYLKSRLLLPTPEVGGDEPSAAELAGMLALRLQKLEAIREAAQRLAEMPRLGREVFARGDPEPVAVDRVPAFDASLYDLLSAYAAQRQRQFVGRVHVRRRTVLALAEAREMLMRLVGPAVDWTAVEAFLTPWLADPEARATVRASTFAAALELVREGRLEIRQSGAFAPLYLRPAPAAEAGG